MFAGINLSASMCDAALPARLFGVGKGSGAAALFMVLGVMGVLVCVVMALDKRIREMEN